MLKITKEQVLKGLDSRRIETIYSYGAFGLEGLACRCGNIAFPFEPAVDANMNLGEFLSGHTEDELAEFVMSAIDMLNPDEKQEVEDWIIGA